jgi:hypothetical protein
MSFFTTADYTLSRTPSQPLIDTPQERMLNLHHALRDRIRMNDWDLHPHWNKAAIITPVSAASVYEPEPALALQYFRSLEQARLVENQMGIEQAYGDHDVQPARHPVIELRLGEDYFAAELVLSPLAWWDQQNFMGKLVLKQHRDTLRHLLYRLEGDYCFGFWGGEHLSDMHLTIWQLLHGQVLDEWLDTFADSRDWLRLGVWYELDSPLLSANHIVCELSKRIGELYSIYEFLLWTGQNNYHQFFGRHHKHARRLYA